MRPLENWVYKDPGLRGKANHWVSSVGDMAREIFALTFLLTVGNLAHCHEWKNRLFIKMGEVLEKQEAALSQLKGMQEKQEQFDGKLQEMQEKLQHVEFNLQELRREMQHLKDKATDSQDSLQRQELESSLRQEISGVISLLETGGIDECSEGSHNCGDYEMCTDKLFKYQCSCLPGFAQDGSGCVDVDECAKGKDECSPLATCRNSVGSYSCSCNPPSEGDGRTCEMDECAQGKDECNPLATCRNSVGSYSCFCNPPFEGDGRTCSCPPGFAQNGSNCQEFPCESPAEVLKGLGCVKRVREDKTFEEMNATCHQAGGRLLQNFSLESFQEVDRLAFPF
ncbi:nidogen-2-like [Macrobrachium nipponense]|uniref:nidogen-2-like n=1 Tax=Macrobrachium nipponense TaxID=159736 RepID=UPI0030C80317